MKKTYISSVHDEDLPEEEILDALAILSWNRHRFLKSLIGHVFEQKKTGCRKTLI